MRIVLAPDSFKESLSAAEAAEAMRVGVLAVLPDALCLSTPMADGGEGTTEAIVDARGGEFVDVDTVDHLGRPRAARIGLVDGRTAVIEVAEAVGLGLVAPADRDIRRAGSIGVAALVRSALDRGATGIIVGLGGSGTNDGGAGMLVGLGARLFDTDDHAVAPEPQLLSQVARVDLGGVDPRLEHVTITLACDVTSPLLGPEGATRTFGPQKGADADDVEVLEQGVAALADALESAAGRSIRNAPGAGAAGGLGAAFLALGAVRRSGVETVIEAVRLDERVAGADLVLTGEGSLDAQTLAGKAPAGVAEVARRHGVPVIGFAGRIDPDAQAALEEHFTAVVPILRRLSPVETALADGAANLTQAVTTALRLMGLGARS